MVSPRTTNPRLAFSAVKPPEHLPSGALKRRFSETDLDTESSACVEAAKRIRRDPDCTDSDLMDIDVDDDVRSATRSVPERDETFGLENGDAQKEKKEEEDKNDESLDDVLHGIEDGLFDEVLNEMEEMLEIEFDPRAGPKPKAKVRKTVSWAENLAVVVGEAAGFPGWDGMDSDSEEEWTDYEPEEEE